MSENMNEFQVRFRERFLNYIENSSNGNEVEFDIYAQPLEAFDWAKAYIPGLIVSSAGGLALFQAEGLIEGYPFYFRYEDNMAELRVGGTEGGIPYLYSDAWWGSSLSDVQVTDAVSFVQVLVEMVPLLQKTLFRWQFDALKVWFLSGSGEWDWVVGDTHEIVSGFGVTPEEGYIDASSPSLYLEANGFTAKEQEKLFKARKVNPVPVNQDTRNISKDNPGFTVL